MSKPWWVRQDDALKGPESVRRLGLSARVENALVRNGVWTVTQVLDLLGEPGPPFPDIRQIGQKGWTEIEAAVERPMLPVSSHE